LSFAPRPTDIPLLILAGGRATRLKHLAVDRPKYLQPVTESMVFADVHLKWVASRGFRRVILAIGHLGEQIRAYCGDGSRWNLEISYIDDGKVPLGTGGAVRAALDPKLSLDFEILAVTYGDTILSVDTEEFLRKFAAAPWADAAMTLFKNTVPGHVCNIDFGSHLSGERMIYDKIHPNAEWSYIDYGFLALRRKAIEGLTTEKTPLDLAEPLAELSRAGKVLGFPVATRFWEIGSPEALNEFQTAFRSDFQSFLKV
jgi:NDP-sugar pyrophosphorylase family protein